MVDPVAIRVEAYRNALIVEAEQLIDRAIARVRVLVGGEDAVPFDETEVVAVAIDPEASRIAMVVDGRDLCLHRTGEVLIGVVSLAIGRGEGIAFVGMTGGTAAEVASDDAVVVDAEQLVEGWVGVVVEGCERIRCCRLGDV